ncbi:malto-oligosyltrehalose synthase [Trinickia terrae]|uniref:Malto-oligosyltrehalose synthase n=1 Tax=Trinickia terrae TaxID=2571161 RepID=A0A4U1IEN6_9BURK|nr:malto-oligosyltrehalose synthase [Trinickia terrae]TKC92166.1 malto-oligosyltrehalose synthase [Trinickia terrae]
MTVPRSTLRLQLHRGFTLDDAAAQLDYFASLGVSHLYLSPITTAVPGSTHGYDTVDYTRVNPELGGEAALLRLADAARARQMGLIADIVPNHMGIGSAHNAWWLDILEWGRHSAFGRHFDVDWHSPDPALRGKALAPCLGAPYGEELEAGRITLQFDRDAVRFFAAYAHHVFPICPAEYAPILQTVDQPELAALAERFTGLAPQAADQPRAEQARDALREFVATEHGMAAIGAALQAYAPDTASGRERLHRLLERQFFRLAWWRTAADEVNWRRFFDVSTLAALRQERPEVFEATHALILRLFAQGVIDGVRVDHVDGLADPREYCQRLRQRLFDVEGERPQQIDGRRAYLIVEKILARREPLSVDWGVDGSTGYDFMNDVGALLHDPGGAAPLADAWAELAGNPRSFADEALIARRKILTEHLSAELDRSARALHRIARDHPATRDFTLTSIRRAVAELAVHFPVYRIYLLNGQRTDDDEPYFNQALEAARQTLPRADHQVLERVAGWLGGKTREREENPAQTTQHANSPNSQKRTTPALFAQLTAPLAAKAIEDTACYRYGRLLSRNEVGADPGEFALSVEDFHAANLARAKHFPHTMLTTATHDHKRGEDVRARLAVLSEIAHEWNAARHAWSTLNAPQRRVLDGNDRDWAPGPAAEAMLYQTLAGCWPLDLDPGDEAGVKALAERVAGWQEKALREAKLRTSWYARDEAYEQASRDFLLDILAPQRRDGFLHELPAFVARIARAGAVNSLLQTVLRMTSPGVPDLYQGTELWDFSLVDPDNRRPVDFARRHAWLTGEPPSEQLANWRDGRVKLGIVHRALTLRAASPALFLEGSYVPLTVRGKLARHAIAFARQHGDAYAIVIGTRFAMALLDEGRDVPHVEPAKWEDTVVVLPNTLAGRALFDWLSPGAPKVDEAGALRVSEALAALPVAVLVEEGVRAA